MVGARGFEPPAHCSQSSCATRLRYAPTDKVNALLLLKKKPFSKYFYVFFFTKDAHALKCIRRPMILLRKRQVKAAFHHILANFINMEKIMDFGASGLGDALALSLIF